MSACTISPATTASPRTPRRRPPARAERATFEGYRRATARRGTRNYIGILTSVNCSASVARFAAQRSSARARSTISGHRRASWRSSTAPGCGHAAYGEGFEVLRRTQWGYASHPNFAGVVMVGLGCEVFQIGRMKKEYGLSETDTFRTLTIQETGGTKKTVEAIVAAIRDICRSRRSEARDAPGVRAGLSAAVRRLGRLLGARPPNPALGAASDILVQNGGTVHPVRDARDLRRRAPAHPRAPRSRSARSSSSAFAGGRITQRRTGGE
jgi:altronate hydrolase